MKTTFEVECTIQEIKKHGNVYYVKIQTEDNRDLSFQITEIDEELHFDAIYSSFNLWHKEEVLMNVLSSILYSGQRHYWDKFIPEKVYLYNRKKLDLEELNLRFKFIKCLPEIDSWITNIPKSDSTKDTYRRSMRVFLQYCIYNGATLRNFGIGDIQRFFKQLEEKSEYYIEKMYYALLHDIKEVT